MGATSIQWTDHSVNPIRFGKGHFCQMVSPGCAHCYSSRLQPRFGNPEFGGVNTPTPDGLWLDDSKLREVLRRRKPTKYFWEDMSDLFGEWVPDAWIDRCFAVMALTPQHTHQVLTKRPERMVEYLAGCDVGGKIKGSLSKAAKEVQGNTIECDVGGDLGFHRLAISVSGWPWPLPNVWLGTSVEDQKRADERIPHLLRCPAAVRFLSVEPLLGPVDLGAIKHPQSDAFPEYAATFNCMTLKAKSLNGRGKAAIGTVETGSVSWVIVGGESGHGARWCNLAWIRSIVEQCKAAGVACFVKQLGAHQTNREGLPHPLRDKKGGDPTEWPEDLRVREFPEVSH